MYFTVTVRATDKYWNRRFDSVNLVQITDSDPNNDAFEPLPQNLVNGQYVFDPNGPNADGLAMVTRNMTGWIVNVSTAFPTDNLMDDDSRAVPVDAGAPSTLQALIYNGAAEEQNVPGIGKSGSPGVKTAGVTFTVRVYLTDSMWNIQTNPPINPIVRVTSNDPYNKEPADSSLLVGQGYQDFLFQLVTASTWTMVAEDTGLTGSDYESSTTTVVTVNPAAASRLQVLLPGEEAEPGNANSTKCSGTTPPYGKTSATPSTQTAGVQFAVTVRITDEFWNLTTAHATATITTSDIYDADPGDRSIEDGQRNVNIKVYTAQTTTILASEPNLVDNTSANLTVNPNKATQLRVIVPGVSRNPGEYSGAPGAAAPFGRTGSPDQQEAGVQFKVTVDACDSWWNIDTSTNPTVVVVTHDEYDTEPAQRALVNGSTTFKLTMVTVGDWVVTSSDTAAVLFSDDSQEIEVQVGTPEKLQILVPGVDPVPGDTLNNGKTGTPDEQIAGEVFTITINVCDKNWNVNTSTDSDRRLLLTTNDQYVDDYGYEDYIGTFTTVNGTVERDMYLVYARAATTWLRVQDDSGIIPVFASNQSAPIDVVANDPTKLRVLLPGQTGTLADPSDGRTGTPDVQTAGTLFNATLSVCDDYWNIADSTEAVYVDIEDPYAVEIGTVELEVGQLTVLDVLCKSASNHWTLTVTDAGGEGYDSQTSDIFTVSASTLTRLLILLPGESVLPGSASGRQYTPAVQEAGTSFQFRVWATDNYWNVVSTNATVAITCTDPQTTGGGGGLPGNQVLQGGKASFQITLKTVEVGGVEDNNYIYANAVAPFDLIGATSTDVTLNPDDCDYLEVTDIASTVAGTSGDVTVTAYDMFGNVADGGTVSMNAYNGEITFTANTDSNWLGTPETSGNGLPDDYTFTTTDLGSVTFTNGITLRMAGSRTVTAKDKWHFPEISGQQTNIIISAGPVEKFTVLPLEDQYIPAGNSKAITAYATDNYYNVTTVESTNLDVTISTYNISFTTYTANNEANDGSYFNVTSSATNKDGAVKGIIYTVSRYAGDQTRVEVVADTKTVMGQPVRGESALIITRGGSADYLEFVQGYSDFTAGVTPNYEDPDEGYLIRRKDKYGNLALTGTTIIDLKTDSGSPNTATTSVKPRHRFLDGNGVSLPNENGDTQSRQDVKIIDGESEAWFYYYEQKASWDGISPDTHTITIDAGLVGTGDPTAPAGKDVFPVTVDPDSIKKIVFKTPPRTLQAGTTCLAIIVHTVDDYNNDSPVTKEETLTLNTESTWYGFITNKGTFTFENNEWSWGGGPWDPDDFAELTIATGTYTASFEYTDMDAGAPLMYVRGTGSPGSIWAMGTQRQTVTPAPIDHLEFISSEYTSSNPLIAGATSWTIRVESQDKFGNGSPVLSDENIIMELDAETDDWAFSVSSATWIEVSTITIPINMTTAECFLQVTRAKPGGGAWSMEAFRSAGGWTPAQQDVVVRGAAISKIVFVTPARKIVANHDQYLTYGATNYKMTIETQDRFGNISNVIKTINFNLQSTSIDGDFAPDGPILNWGGAPIITISSGSFTTSFYYKDILQGNHTVYVDEIPSGGYPATNWKIAQQAVSVYPSDVDSFEVTHDGMATVDILESIIIKAVDDTANHNFANGHPDPYNPYGSTSTWQYYVGIASISSIAPNHPAGQKPWFNYATWDFQESLDAGSPGIASILVRDSVVTDDGGNPSAPPDTWDVPPIKVSVVDISTPGISGLSEYLTVSGAIIKPYIDPITGDRVAPVNMYQDNKNVLMERLDIFTNYSTATWNGVRVDLVGTVDDDDINVIRLWKDNDGEADFDQPDDTDPNNLLGSSVDVLLASAAFNTYGVAELDVSQKLGYAQTITETPNYYFFTVDCDYSADPDHYASLYWEKSYFASGGRWGPTGAQVSANNFNIQTPTTTIKTSPGTVLMKSYKLLAPTDTVTQGQDNIGVLRLDMSTDKYTIDWTAVNVTLTGAGVSDSDIKNIRIYRDINGSKQLEPLADEPITVGSDKFGTQIPGVAIIELRNPLNLTQKREQVITQSTQTYFISISMDDSATIGADVGIKIDSPVDVKAQDEGGQNRVSAYYDIYYPFGVQNDDGDGNPNDGDPGDEPDLFPAETDEHLVQPTIDSMVMDWDKSLGNVKQGEKNKVFAILDLNANAHSVIWEGVTVNKVGTLDDSWIDNVKVWWYISGSTDAAGYPVVNTSTNSPTGKRDLMVSNGADVFVSSQCAIIFAEEKKQDLRTGATTYLITMDLDPFAPEGATVGLLIPGTTYFTVAWPDIVDGSKLPILVPAKTVIPYTDTVHVDPEDVFNKLVADKMVNQADKNLPIIELELNTNLSYAWWKDIGAFDPALTIFQKGTADADWEIDDIKLWYDQNNDGQLQQLNDIIISSGNIFVSNKCEINISDYYRQQILPNSKGYFITMDIDNIAVPGNTIELEITEAANFSMAAPDIVSEDNLPFRTSAHQIYASPRIMYVTATDTAPATVIQGADDVCMLKLEMQVSGYQVEWEQLFLEMTGPKGTEDEDIEAVKIYRDAQLAGAPGYGKFDPFKDIVAATAAFSDKSVLIDFTEDYGAQIVSTTPTHWFVAYDVAADATPGITFGARIQANNYFTVAYPHEVSTLTYTGANAFPIDSSMTQIEATSDVMIVNFINAGVGEVEQGDSRVKFGTIKLVTDQNSVEWTGIDVHRFGTGTDNDVSAVKIYKDVDNNNDFDPVEEGGVDTLISYGTEVFIDTIAAVRFPEEKYQSIFPTEQTYFLVLDIAPLAQVDATVGVRLLSGADFKFTGTSDSVSNANLPAATTDADIKEYADLVTITGYRPGTPPAPLTPDNVIQGEKDVLMEYLQMTTHTDAAGDTEAEADITGMRVKIVGDLDPRQIAAVNVYKDSDNNNTFNPTKDMRITSGTDTFTSGDSANITFTQVQTIGTTKRSYYVTYDFAVDATPMRTASTKFDSVGFFFVKAPNYVEASVFPIESGQTTVRTMEMNFDLQDSAPAGARQGDKGIPMAKFNVRVATHTAAGAGGEPTLEYLRVTLKGDVHYSRVTAINVYQDDGDGALNTSKDTPCTDGTDKFDASKTAVVTLTNNNVITDEYKTYFLTYDLSSNATVGAFMAAQIDQNTNNYINIIPESRIIIEDKTPVFFLSSYVLVRHSFAPTTPAVKVDKWINSATTVKGSWKSQTNSPAGITHNMYKAAMSSWKDAGTGEKADATVQGLSLKHGELYKFQAKTATKDNSGEVMWSYIGDAGFRVDLNPPSKAGAPSPQQEQGGSLTSYNVNWKHAKDNKTRIESGIKRYELQERRDTSPIWKTIRLVDGEENNVFIEGQPENHFYYYRVRAQDNAGNWGDWSDDSSAAITGLPDEVVSEVSNYPNPVRFDKGDQKTTITYLINEDADVDIYLYDMMGYLVKRWKFKKGTQGGRLGENHFDWFGINENEANVAKGGYILRIVVKSSKGTIEKTRKIAIIR
ncbi:MAG: hypothetical protein JXJ19_04970 [Elusimicrobia bacterium]|nr:hypothetical protein [Elusimicrobiota bacterium]